MLADYHYSYDGNGNRIRKDSLTGSTTYAYDSLNRLAKVQYPKGLEEFTYDKADNRIRRLTEKEEELYQYDVCNRLVSKESRALGESAPMSQNPKEKIKTHASLSTDKRKISTFQYDNQGNLLREERKTEGSRQESIYSYDGFNRQKKIVNFENKTQINRYDGEGLRHEMEENGRLVKFLYHDREAVAEEKEDGKYIRYIRGYDLIASDSESARTYYHYASDEQESITHVLGEDENGEYDLKNYYEYGAFGDFREKYEEVENRFGYNGEIFDPIGGQYYLRARYYNPVIGRFTQEDTYYGDGLNLYAYCRNLPVGYEDPSGHVAKSICEKKLKELEEKKANGTLTDAEKKQLERYERAKNNPLYQLERETGKSSRELYNELNDLEGLRKKIQKGEYTPEQLKTIRKAIDNMGKSDAFEAEMKKMHFGKYLEVMVGSGDPDMIRKHAHHILFKTGNGRKQRRLVKEGQEILRRYGIDPVIGLENLIWAPNVKGQHTAKALKKVVDRLKKCNSYDDVVQTLQLYGNIAKNR